LSQDAIQWSRVELSSPIELEKKIYRPNCSAERIDDTAPRHKIRSP